MVTLLLLCSSGNMSTLHQPLSWNYQCSTVGNISPTYLGKQLMPSLVLSLQPSLVSLLSCPNLYNILNIYTMTYTHIQYPTHIYNTCRILRSVLQSAAVIVVRPVLIIEVCSHWQQVKGIKSCLTLSGGRRSHGQTVHLWMSLCWCHSVDVTLLMSTVNITLLMSLCIS